MTYNFNLTN